MIEIISNEGKKIHSIFESGDYFGHLSLILREKRTASARALTYCEIFVLTKDNFERIKNEYPEFRQVLTKISSEKTDKISAQILEGLIL